MIEFPPAFVKRMERSLQNEWSSFIDAFSKEATTSIRINTKKKKIILPNAVPWANSGYYLDKRPSFTLDPTFHAGAYYVQEASSMLLEQAVKQSVNLHESIRALDLCASPGGKSTHIVSLLNDDSLLISNEVIRTRASVLSENIQKWGYGNVIVTNNDPSDFEKLTGYFDLIVVDAPCSGEGLFRKDPNSMRQWSEENVLLCSQRQQRIMADIWPSLKENGILIYSTCTYNEAENENNLEWLSNNNQVEFISLKLNSDWGIEEVKKAKAIGYRCLPHKVKGEGFFISVIRKKEAVQSVSIKSKNSFQLASKKIKDTLIDWQLPHDYNLVMLDDLIVSLPGQYITEIDFISRSLKTVLKGTAIATQKHDKFIPEHSLALSVHLNASHFKTIELTLEEAILYLKKETLMIREGERGFSLVTYQHIPLGWVNLLGNRINNLYPSGWRILMR